MMPYVILRESYINGVCCVDGLPLNEFRILAEKASASPDSRDEKNRRVEFTTPTYNILNCLEQMGYKVVTSGAFVTGQVIIITSVSMAAGSWQTTINGFPIGIKRKKYNNVTL